MIEIIRDMIREDIGFQDITTEALIDPSVKVTADIVSKSEGIIAGVKVAGIISDEFKIALKAFKNDGDPVSKNETVLTLEGNASTILTIERTLLNLMMRMSGIATVTSELIRKVRVYSENLRIAATRKTTPGLQWFEKEAVRIGGGDPHRFRLDDCAMIKDNHLAIVGDVEAAIMRVKKCVSFTKKIEIEVESTEDAVKAARAGADIILLDNMEPYQIERTVSVLKKENLRDQIIIEASGGINADNIEFFASTGIDVISMGFITHSAPPVDLSLEIRSIH